MSVESLPPVESVPAKDKSGLSIASLVLGIVSLCPSAIVWPCSGLFGLAGLILGILGLKSPKKGLATAGIILSVLALLWTIIAIILTAIGASSGFMDQWQNYLNEFNY
jgi:uncharacterized membrane protein